MSRDARRSSMERWKTNHASFAELQERPQITATEFLDTLEDYVKVGAGISPGVVLEQIRRCRFTRQQIRDIRALLRLAEKDNRRRQPQTAREYRIALRGTDILF